MRAHQIALGELGGAQIRCPGRPVRARVRHGLAEHEAVELVAYVVMMADRGGIPTLVVPAPTRGLHLLCRRLRGRADDPQAQRGFRECLLGASIDADAGTAARVRHLVEGIEAGDQVPFDVDIAGDVGSGETEVVRDPQQAPQSTPVDDGQLPGRICRAGTATSPSI